MSAAAFSRSFDFKKMEKKGQKGVCALLFSLCFRCKIFEYVRVYGKE